MTSFKFQLGTYVKDRVTHFAGVILGRADYLTSCNTYWVQPEIAEYGKSRDAQWFDESRLELDPGRTEPLV